MSTAIRVRNLGKKYQLGTRERGYATLREALVRAAKAPFERFRRLSGRTSAAESFWALKDVSFDVQEGEVVGIIGRNGAGKSTLLKVLSQITEPTTGEVELHGRVGSLLEVGTGFHPELSGRENIYLNGAILGMKRTWIRRGFDEIVAFAEVEEFLDTPVKRYSSGMYTRLAFSVAAHLEPEILIVDEVLAVGDAAFQKKCLGKMGEVAKGGRTVLCVSHNMQSIEHLCSRVVLMEKGQIQADGEPRLAIEKYLAISEPQSGSGDLTEREREPGHFPVLRRVETQLPDGTPTCAIVLGKGLRIVIHYIASDRIYFPFFGLLFTNQMGTNVFWVQTRMQGFNPKHLPKDGLLVCDLPSVPLVPGFYSITAGCGTQNEQLDVVRNAAQIEVIGSDFYGTGQLPYSGLGVVVVEGNWSFSDKRPESHSDLAM